MASQNAGLEWISDLFHSYKKTQIIIAACEHELFDVLENAERHLSAGEIAGERGLDPDATERLLNACVSLRLLKKNEEGCYSNTDSSSKWLLKSRTEAGLPSMWSMAEFQKTFEIPGFTSLADSIKSGTRAGQDDFLNQEKDQTKELSTGEVFSNMFESAQARQVFLSGMDAFISPVAAKLATLFDLTKFESALDIGAGSGTMAITLKKTYPNMKVATFDLPELKTVLSKRLSGHDVDMHWGSFLSGDLPPADLYVMAHVIHDWKPDKVDVILANAFKSLNKGGALLLLENVLPDECPQKCGDVFGSLLDLMMLVVTGGRERTFAEYNTLLERHGFKNVQWKSAGNESTYDVIMARKM